MSTDPYEGPIVLPDDPSVGPEVQVLGRAGDHIVAVRQGRMLATAFHPEMTGDRRIHKLFVDMLSASAAHDSHPGFGASSDSGVPAGLM